MKLLISFILLTIIVVFFSGCVQPSGSIIEDFKFNPGNGKCGEAHEANMTLINKKIIFSGFIAASTPCYELEASYSINRVEFAKAPTTDVITVTITKKPIGEVCIQCIGEIPFNGEIMIDRGMWDSGNYGIEIVHEGRELARLYNYVV